MCDLTNETTISGNTENSQSNLGILPALAKADPQLVKEAKARLKAANEKLAEISRENGALGGRPRIVRKDLAKRCVDAVYSKHGQLLLRRYMKSWYQYMDGCYSKVDDEDIDMEVTGWLSADENTPDVTDSIVRDVLKNMRGNKLCGLPSKKYTMPCFLSTGKSAEGFVFDEKRDY